MEPDKTLHRVIVTTRITHSVFLASVPAAIALVALLPRLGVAPVYESDDPTLLAIQITLGGLSLLLLTTGLLWPKLARWREAEAFEPCPLPACGSHLLA